MTDKTCNMLFLRTGNSADVIPRKACMQTMRYALGWA
jgi:hypothetical protein